METVLSASSIPLSSPSGPKEEGEINSRLDDFYTRLAAFCPSNRRIFETSFFSKTLNLSVTLESFVCSFLFSPSICDNVKCGNFPSPRGFIYHYFSSIKFISHFVSDILRLSAYQISFTMILFCLIQRVSGPSFYYRYYYYVLQQCSRL